MFKIPIFPFHSCAILILTSMVLWPAVAAAELSFSFGASGRYDDNVIGLTADKQNGGARSGQMAGSPLMKGGPSDMTGTGGGAGRSTQKQSDFSASLSADLSSDHDLSEATSLLFMVSAEHTAYNTFSDFDFTIGSLSAGVSHDFSDMISGRISLSGYLKDYTVTDRNSTAVGAGAGLREHLSDSFWLKQAIDIEVSTATSSLFSYTGSAADIRAGYDLSESQQVSVGYYYLVRDYKNTSPSLRITSRTASVDWFLDLSDEWTLSVGYGHERAEAKTGNTVSETTNNSCTVGIRYDY